MRRALSASRVEYNYPCIPYNSHASSPPSCCSVCSISRELVSIDRTGWCTRGTRALTCSDAHAHRETADRTRAPGHATATVTAVTSRPQFTRQACPLLRHGAPPSDASPRDHTCTRTHTRARTQYAYKALISVRKRHPDTRQVRSPAMTPCNGHVTLKPRERAYLPCGIPNRMYTQQNGQPVHSATTVRVGGGSVV